MYKRLKGKIEKIAESYADFVDLRIRNALECELADATVMTEINEGIRMLGHISATLERIDRLNRGNDANSQF